MFHAKQYRESNEFIDCVETFERSWEKIRDSASSTYGANAVEVQFLEKMHITGGWISREYSKATTGLA